MTVLALNAKKIKKSFYSPEKIEVLKGVDLEIPRGKSVAIMGASGEGKTTLLHLLGTLDEADSGKIELAGVEVTPSNQAVLRNEQVGFVFQAFHLLEDYTALENVLMPCFIGRQKVSKSSPCYQKAFELLSYMGLSKRASFFSKLLSGGERQRVALARALINDPEVIFADEPTGNLDHQTSSKVHEILFESTVGKGRSLLLVTHDPSLAKLCDACYELKEGQLQPLSRF